MASLPFARRQPPPTLINSGIDSKNAAPSYTAICIVIAILTGLATAGWSISADHSYWLTPAPFESLQDPTQWGWIVVNLMVNWGSQLLLFGILGFVLVRSSLNLERLHPARTALTIGTGWIVVCAIFQHPKLIGLNILDLIMPMAGMTMGIILSPRRVITGIRIIGALGILLTLTAAWVVTETKPMLHKGATAQTQGQVASTTLFKVKNPRSLTPGQSANIRLSQQQLNQLLRFGLQSVSHNAEGEISIKNGGAGIRITLPVPWLDTVHIRFLNFELAADTDIWNGRLQLHIRTIRLGGLRLPTALLTIISPGLESKLQYDPRIGKMISAIDSLDIGPEFIRIRYGAML